MWGQRNLKFATAMGIQLLAKIHCLESQLGDIGHSSEPSRGHVGRTY
jgi:hypothetical protein